MEEVDGLREIMRQLRDPKTGCPWDIEQTFTSIAPYTIEEAYEVADAIERGDLGDLKSELGDLLLQIIFHSQMAEEQGEFTLADVADAISAKLVRRHPHVFDDLQLANAGEVIDNWENIKSEERKTKNQTGVLDDVAINLPATLRAQKLQKRAARVGFDWPDVGGVFAKLDEELAELTEAISLGKKALSLENKAIESGALSDGAITAIKDEMGDVLFTCVNLARHLGVEAEDCLRAANHKFEQRFRGMELLADKQKVAFSGLEPGALEALWQLAKHT